MFKLSRFTLMHLCAFLERASGKTQLEAALSLGSSQAQISRNIREMESFLGYELFHKSNGRRGQLTIQGESMKAP